MFGPSLRLMIFIPPLNSILLYTPLYVKTKIKIKNGPLLEWALVRRTPVLCLGPALERWEKKEPTNWRSWMKEHGFWWRIYWWKQGNMGCFIGWRVISFSLKFVFCQILNLGLWFYFCHTSPIYDVNRDKWSEVELPYQLHEL